MSPPSGGNVALRSPHFSAPPLAKPPVISLFALLMKKLSESHKTQNQRFGSLLINADFLWVGKEVNSDLSFDFALKGALCEGAGSAVFFRRD